MRPSRLLYVLVAVTMVAGWVLTSAPAAQAGGYCQQWHTVQAGENLFRISLRYNTTMSWLQTLNNITNPNYIFVGQSLCIAGSVNTPPQYPPQNPPGTPTNVYVVQPGDTFYGIARKVGTTYAVMVSLNPTVNPNWIYAGQQLVVPLPGNEPVPMPASYLVALVNVRLRSGPGMNYAVEGTMRAGEQAHVTGRSADGQWYRVTCVTDASGNCWVTANPSWVQVVGLPQGPGV